MPLERTREWLDAQSGYWHDTGVQIHLSRGGDVLLDEGFGWSSEGVPMTRETINLWMSSGKPLTAVAMMQLVERGVCDLDDPVADVIPEFAVHGKGSITTRHLLTHTGGFRAADMGWKPEAWDEVIQRICAVRPEPRWTPGEKAGYHIDGSWYMLGELVSRISGESLPRYLQRNIFRPLGMNHSWMGIPGSVAASYGDGIAEVLNLVVEPAELMPGLNGPDGRAVVRPGGNTRGPASDLAAFYRAMLQGGAPILQPETAASMVQRHREGMHDQSFRHVIDWGLGFIINSNQYGADTVPYGYGRLASDTTFGHSGRESSTGFADPLHEIVVAVVFNSMPGAAAHHLRMRGLLECMYEDLGIQLAT